MRTLVWFRNDLRTLDNPALQAAMDAGDEGCIAIFFITPREWSLHNWGSPKVSFHMDCLAALKNDLEAINIPLLIRPIHIQDDIPRLVHSCAMQHGCSQVHVNRDCGVDEQRRDEQTVRLLLDDNISFSCHEGNSILPVHEIVSGKGTPYGVFSPFKKNWMKTLIDCGVPTTSIPTPQKKMGLRSCPIPDKLADFPHWAASSNWIGGQDEARRRLDTFLKNHVNGYSKNRDVPSVDGTSTLSPWLSSGAIGPVSCLHAMMSHHGPDLENWPAGPSTWLNELIWREFYRHVMLGFPQVSMNKPMQEWTELVPWTSNPDHFEAWTRGETGIDIVDAGTHQLLKTGWMHNRVRMITAMFLTKNLLVDWRKGEQFFANHLVDYDFASNNGGWQWAASTGTDAAPYFRIFNPQRQAETWDPDSTYVKRWLPRNPGSRSPIVDLKQSRQDAIKVFKRAHETYADLQSSSQTLVDSKGDDLP